MEPGDKEQRSEADRVTCRQPVKMQLFMEQKASAERRLSLIQVGPERASANLT